MLKRVVGSEKVYTFADLRAFPQDELWELVDGVPHAIAAPLEIHQFISVKLVQHLVLPDLVVICDEKKRKPQGCRGAPDLVIEILSSSSLSHDQVLKLNLYEKHKVKEFWLVQPEGGIMVFGLQKTGRYGRPEIFDRTMSITSFLFPDLKIPAKNLFPPEPPPTVRESPRKYRVAR